MDVWADGFNDVGSCSRCCHASRRGLDQEGELNPVERMRALGRAIWRERLMYVFILPGVIYYLTFIYLPLLGNIIAFQDWSPYRASQLGPFQGFLSGPWIGLQNFAKMFSDPDFRIALTNTIQIEVLRLIFAFPAPLLLALLLNSMVSEKLKRTMQTIVYISPTF